MNVVFGANSVTPQRTSEFYAVGVGRYGYANSYAPSATAMPKCTLRGMAFQVTSYSAGSSTGLIVMKNGVNTSMQLVTAGGATGWFENVSDEVSFEAGDTAVFRGQAQIFATFNNFTVGQFLDGPGPFPVRYSTGSSVSWTSTLQILAPGINTPSLETSFAPRVQTRVSQPGAVSDVSFDVWTNTKNAATTVRLNVNAEDVGVGVMVPAGATGRFDITDPPHPIVAGDAYCFTFRSSSTGSMRLRGLRHTLTVAGPDVEYLGAPGQSAAPTTPRYTGIFTPSGWIVDASASGQRVPFDLTVKSFRAFIAESGGAYTITLQKNGVDTGLVINKPASFTGEIESEGSPVSFSEGDRATFKLSTHTGVTNIDRITTVVSNGSAPPPVVSPPPGDLTIEGAPPHLIFGQQVLPVAGDLTIEGLAPVLTEFFGVRPLPGALVVNGAAPALQFDAELSPIGGALRVTGRVPRVLVGITVGPAGGALAVEGFSPGLFTQTAPLASQIASMALGAPAAPPVAAGQLAALALAEPPPPPVRASQAALLGLAEVVPHVAASQAALLVLAHGSDCVTAACQLWTIYRRDGKVFRYTSHDQVVKRGPFVYSPCRSLDPSASENASTLGSVGDIELTGIIDDDGISEADLYGGLFDDAYVTVDLFSWGDATVPPRRLAAGWTGELSQGVTGFQMQVLGPGARLGQQALVQMVTPACRWVFGDARCGVNVESMKVAGTVIASPSRGRLKVALPAEPAGRQWANGRIRFVSGPNAGQVVETKSVNFATGEVVTWVSPGFLSDPGDAVELLPGCDLARDGGCTLYKNVINFGGFPDVPGSDALLESPDAKY